MNEPLAWGGFFVRSHDSRAADVLPGAIMRLSDRMIHAPLTSPRRDHALCGRKCVPHDPLMCGRYASFLPPDLIARLFGARNPLPNLKQTWNMAPSNSAPVVRRHPETGERHLDALTWGLVPSFTKDLKAAPKPINARAETVATSGMFRSALAKRRCLAPADAFYEWKATPDGKQPYAIARSDGAVLAFAGLWEGWRAPDGEILRSFAIITTKANAQMSELHTRMPVILEPADWAAWLDREDGDAPALLRPAPEGILRIWPVGKRVGNVRNDGPDLLEPYQPHPAGPLLTDPAGPNPL